MYLYNGTLFSHKNKNPDTCNNIVVIMLSEIRHKMANTVSFHLHEISRIGKFIEAKSRLEFFSSRLVPRD